MCVSSQKILLFYILPTFRNNLSNNTTQNRLLIEKLRGNCSQLLALFKHYFEILSTF